MPAAPPEIVDGLEAILDIFLSDIRHRERAAYVLCDNLVEMACKMKHTQYARRHNLPVIGRCDFHEAMVLRGVRLSQELRDRLQSRRDTRNLMQHQSASAAVDTQTCADAICDIQEVLPKLWGQNALDNLRDWHHVALRIVRLYSCNGDSGMRQQFEDAMRGESWRGDAERRQPRVNETIIEAGLRSFWGVLVKQAPAQVEQVINTCQIP